MNQTVQDFIKLVQTRSHENQKSLNILFQQGLIGNCISILRQELDTFIRIIYLGLEPNLKERERLMKSTLNGEKWRTLSKNNKLKNITDREMIDLSNKIKGYVEYVYKFGCSFIHLSDYHNYKESNPFNKLTFKERFDISFYLNQYHGFPKNKELSLQNIISYLPDIFNKISSNSLYYNDQLIKNEIIDF